MRVCLMTPNFLPAVGGAERDADVIVRGLIARGHEAMVLAQRPRGGGPGLAAEPLPYPVRWYRRPPAQHLWPELLARPAWSAWRAWRFDVMLSFYAYPTGYAASCLRRRRFALVMTPRGGDLYPQFHALTKPRVAAVIAEGYRRADRIVSISQYLTDRLRDVCGEPLPPVDQVPNGIDLAAHDAALAQAEQVVTNPPVQGPFVLHLARVAPVKRQDVAIRAVAKLRDYFETRKLTYAIVGDGNGMPAARQLVDELKVGHLVKLLGTREGDEKHWLYGHAELMVSTSREEGFGNVVIEAMASGLPMVGSDIPPHRALIADHGWGTLFPEGDADALADALHAALERDNTDRRRAARAARERYSLAAMLDGYESACARAVAERPRQGPTS
jgi:L-malate glycosyltransferase